MDRERVKEEVRFCIEDGEVGRVAGRILYNYLKGLGFCPISHKDKQKFAIAELEFTNELTDVIADILINNYSSLK